VASVGAGDEGVRLNLSRDDVDQLPQVDVESRT
jgi:hypothetical protein